MTRRAPPTPAGPRGGVWIAFLDSDGGSGCVDRGLCRSQLVCSAASQGVVPKSPIFPPSLRRRAWEQLAGVPVLPGRAGPPPQAERTACLHNETGFWTQPNTFLFSFFFSKKSNQLVISCSIQLLFSFFFFPSSSLKKNIF